MTSTEQKNGLDKAKQLLLQIRNDFLAELPERIDDIEPLVLALEKSKQDPEIFENLYRAIHSLKGSSGTHGLGTISYICHHFEDALNELSGAQDTTPELIDNFLTYLDMIRRCSIIAAEEAPDYSDIEKELANIRQKRQRGKCTGLIVESSSFMRNLYTDSVDQRYMEFAMVEDGLDALAILLRDKYDFVIMGSETKSLNGTALLYALKAAGGKNKNIKTIMVTSKNSTQFIEQLAPDFFLNKDKDLFENLQQALNTVAQNKS
jgi:chemotaxis protein histidine kinase CheA